ncbi:MAG: ATPase [Gammaproteobacteria bacterium]|nr:ATPase [Gammaproteobacteria bacterium]
MTTVGARLDRLVQEREHDTYKSREKLSEPTVCPSCGAVFQKGRWQWLERPAGAEEHTCPACRRIEDRVPAGYVSISGDFFTQHKDEIMGLVHNQEDREKSGHPLNRLIDIVETDGGVEITTTDMHLPRDIGVALEKAYEGDLDFHYEEESNILRVKWSR